MNLVRGRLKKLGFIVLLLTALTLVACSDSGKNSTKASKSGSDEEVVIKIGDWLPGEHEVTKKIVKPWIERIEELGEGQIKVEFYPAEQMASGNELLEAVQNKVVDIAHVGPQYYSDKLPLSSIPANPGLIDDGISGTKAYNRLVEEELAELEWEPLGVKPIAQVVTDPYQIVNSKHPVKTLADFKGLKIRTAGSMQEKIIDYGKGTPVSMPGSQMITAWERKTVDGTLLSLISWPAYQLEEIAKYATINGKFSTFTITYGINQKSWDSWPEKVQEAVRIASEEMMETGPEIVKEENQKLLEEYQANSDVEFYEYSDSELKEWDDALAPINQEWADKLDSEGSAGTETLEKFKQYIEEETE